MAGEKKTTPPTPEPADEAKDQFKTWFREAMSEWDTEQKEAAEAEAAKNPPEPAKPAGWFSELFGG